MLSVQSHTTTMAGWDIQNSTFLHRSLPNHTPNPGSRALTSSSSNHTPNIGTHDDFVTKYLQNHSITSSAPEDNYFQVTHNRRSGILFTSPPSSSGRKISQTFGPSFCNKENLDQCVSYLDQEMTILGFPTLFLSPDRGQSGVFDIVQLVNCCYELIQRHQQNLRKLEEQETKQMRGDSDLEHLQSNHSRLKLQLEQLERDNVSLTEKERQQLSQNKTLAVKLKTTREEMKKLESIVKHRDTQFKHDLKKKEREINKMKERIHQLLTDKNQERRIGMDILNSLQRTDGKRATWKTGKTGTKHEEEMYRLIITNYEERQKEMMLENQVLRESLSNMQKELVDLLNREGDKGLLSQNNNDSDDDTTSIDDSSVDELSHGHFQMPYQMVREGIESSLRQKWQRLREHIQRMEKEKLASQENKENSGDPNGTVILPGSDAPTIENMEDEISRLKDKVQVYHSIIEQQEQVLHSVQDTSMDDGLMALLKDSQFLEEKETLADEKRMFYQQKASFEKERRNFTDAAIRLGRERKKFEEERGTFLQQQLMLSPTQSGTSPPLRPAKYINKSNSPGGHHSEHTPSSLPTNDNTPKGQRLQQIINTPTTVELYRALKLIPDRGECLNSSRESLHAPSYYSDTDQSGVSTPRSGITTPRSVCSQSSGTSSRRITNQMNSAKRGGDTSSKASGSRTDNLRTPHGHRTKKGEGTGKRK
ncbi:afadin- and alpha-actinin-binding protein B-like [Asterias rubens]|uniref:afadin- and alpha-actinin-binding protein B-like n=1 Tax=Asterias rubens TaxID=7604 RepID=UPI0014557802|nr:afadin- and alpha-actinin-binding protein B-like [Asterias rubens]XP_033636386.1 afadin- and alpha-actinin-binding protein B-like [Asterias rubens]XP_033636387.1 afadin- and alpha-actinin-binding protein B-like [Asterias rubens]